MLMLMHERGIASRTMVSGLGYNKARKSNRKPDAILRMQLSLSITAQCLALPVG